MIGIAIQLHRALGPGLFEHVYRQCLEHDLIEAGLKVTTEVPVPVVWEGATLECGFRADLVIDDVLVVEVKAVEALLPVHRSQLLTYLRFGGWTEGLLMNFNQERLADGLRSVIRTNGKSSGSSQ